MTRTAEDCVPAGISAIVESAGGRHPANDGAHRLGWWIAEHDDIGHAAGCVAATAQVSRVMLERFIVGDAEPSGHVSDAIEMATGGDVRSDDWLRGGPLHWEDRPLPRRGR